MNKFAFAVAAVMSLSAFDNAAQAAVGSLGDCYNRVISACNQKQNVNAAHSCANSGMNACDKEFSKATVVPIGELNRLKQRTLRAVERSVRPMRIAD